MCATLPGIDFAEVSAAILGQLRAGQQRETPAPLPLFRPVPASFDAFVRDYVPDFANLSATFERHAVEALQESGRGVDAVAAAKRAGRRPLLAYLTFLYRSSWAMPTWADSTGILRSLPANPPTGYAATQRDRTTSGRYEGRNSSGLYVVRNFCVTLDGRLLLTGAKGNRLIEPLNSLDEHRVVSVTKFTNNALLRQAKRFPTNLSAAAAEGRRASPPLAA